EDSRRRRRWREPQGHAELAVEVTPAEGDVVAVGEPEAGVGQALAQGPQYAGLAHAGIADQHCRRARLDDVAELIDDALLGRRQPELHVGHLLGEGGLAQAEVREISVAHQKRSSSSMSWARARPAALSSRAPGGSKATVLPVAVSTPGRRGCRLVRAFWMGSTGCRSRRLSSCSTHGARLGSARQRPTVTMRPAR